MGNIFSYYGDNLNEWQQPVEKFGYWETGYKNKIISRLRSFSIPENEWQATCEKVDIVLSHLLNDLKHEIHKTFPGLVLGDYVKQGSSREGLKVKDPCEFDCILPFSIGGMELSQTTLQDYSGSDIPGLIKLKATNGYNMKRKYPWIERYSILEDDTNYINGKTLQRQIFTKVFDRVILKTNETPGRISGGSYRVTRGVRPPTIELHVTTTGWFLSSNTTIYVDVVPGIRISSPYEKCHRYAVMKWINKRTNHVRFDDYDFVWRNCSSGYEKLVMDVSRDGGKKEYIMTSCRIVKTYMASINQGYNQLGSVFKSYQLKNICLYCLLYLKDASINGVQDALGYFICFMQIALDEAQLPHFFLGNEDVNLLIADCYFVSNCRTYNLLNVEDDQRLNQARRGFQKMKNDLSGLYTVKDKLNRRYYEEFLYKINPGQRPESSCSIS